MRRTFNEHITRKVSDLCGTWRFLMDPEKKGEELGYTLGLPEGEMVTVPSVWNTDLGKLNYEGVAWYEKTFYTQGGTLLFDFESVMTQADVYFDGNHVGSHYGAFSEFDIIVKNVKEGFHTLVVRVDSSVNEKSIPQRKVDWFNYGGIARDVSLHSLEGISILSNHIKYTLSKDLTSADVSSTIELFNANGEKCQSRVLIAIGEHEIYAENIELDPYETKIIHTPCVKIDNVDLWDIDDPVLYSVVASTDTDDLIDRIGFRYIEASNNKITLNGRGIEIRGVNRHEEHPDWGFAFPAQLMKKDVDLIRDLGCNSVRGSHYPQSRAFVDMLDERGILFWSEIPIWGCGFSESALNDPDVVERGLEMHKEMVKYYYNHPSIIIWGMHNEVWTPYPCVYEISKKYSEFLRENGGNRLITHATLCPLEDPTYEFDDIICINLYNGWYYGDLKSWDKLMVDMAEYMKKTGNVGKPVIMSEFGAGALAGYHSHFDKVRWSEESQADLLEYCLNLFHKTDYIHGFYIWQFCNIRTWHEMNLNRVRCFNNKGILDEHRNPKAGYFAVRKLYHQFASEENN